MYKKTHLKIGDKVKLTASFLRDGRSLFGREFCQPKKNHKFTINNIIYGNGQKDGHYEYVADVVIVDLGSYNPKNWVKVGNDQAQLCSKFLEIIQNDK